MANLHPFQLARLIIFLAGVLLVLTLEQAAGTHTALHQAKTFTSSKSSSHSFNSSKFETTTSQLSSVNGVGTKQADRDSLQHKKEGPKFEKNKKPRPESVECGRVPIYEQAFTVSINKTAEELAARSDTRGDSRILYGLNAVV